MSDTSSLEELLKRSADGDKTAAKEFLSQFLTTKVYVPERHQNHPLSHSPEYPNEFFTLLGVHQNETTSIPIFTEASGIKEWSGHELLYKEISVTKLLVIIPDNWWLTYNPQSEFGKEFSPWEVEQLRTGADAIDDIVSEIYLDEGVKPLELVEVSKEEYSPLKDALKIYAESKPQISEIYLFRHGTEEHLHVGVTITDEARRETIQEELESLVGRELIGGETYQVFVNKKDKTSDIISMLYSKGAPFYRGKSNNFLNKLLKLFK